MTAAVDAVYAQWFAVPPWERHRCTWVMDPESWRALVRAAAWPELELEVRGPQPDDRLLGLPVVVDGQAVGIRLEPAPQPPRLEPPPRPVWAHPRTRAIDEEFGWDDAQVVTFPKDGRAG